MTYRQAGDTYILLEYGPNVLDLALRLRVYLLMQKLRELGIEACWNWRRACAPCRSALIVR